MENKVVVITGASRGLGKTIAETFSAKGARVIVSARDTTELESVAKSIGGTAITSDVTSEVSVHNLAKQVIDQFGKIDIWINNAGIWLPATPIEEVDMEKAHSLFEVNVFGTIYGCRAAIPQMKKQGSGTIINIVSTAALQGRPLFAMYSATKHAEKGVTDSIREELKDTGIKVVGIYPGGIKTHLFDESKPKEFDDFLSTKDVAERIIKNFEKDAPENEVIMRRPGQV